MVSLITQQILTFPLIWDFSSGKYRPHWLWYKICTTHQTNLITNQKYKSTNTIINLRVKCLKLFTYLGLALWWPNKGHFAVLLWRSPHISSVGTLWTNGAGDGFSSERWWLAASPASPACLFPLVGLVDRYNLVKSLNSRSIFQFKPSGHNYITLSLSY